MAGGWRATAVGASRCCWPWASCSRGRHAKRAVLVHARRRRRAPLSYLGWREKKKSTSPGVARGEEGVWRQSTSGRMGWCSCCCPEAVRAELDWLCRGAMLQGFGPNLSGWDKWQCRAAVAGVACCVCKDYPCRPQEHLFSWDGARRRRRAPLAYLRRRGFLDCRTSEDGASATLAVPWQRSSCVVMTT